MQMRLKKVSYLNLVWIIMAVSGIVIIEPAPVDIGIALLLALGIVFRKIKFNEDIHRGLVLLFVFFMTNILSLVFAEGFAFGLRYFMITTYLMASLIFFVGIANHYGQKAVDVLFLGYIAAAVTSALLSIGVYFSLIPDFAVILKFGRMAGLFKDPNVFGPFMIPPALYAISRLEKGSKRLIWAGVLIITSLAIFLSYSRAAWGGYALSLAVYLVFRFVKKPTLKQVFQGIILLTLVITVVIYMLKIPSIRDAFNNRFSIQNYDSQRFSKQLEAIAMSRKFPLGAGPGQANNVINYSVHNSYIMILLENGVLGLLSYVSFLIYSLWLSFKKARKTNNSVYIISFATILSTLAISLVIDVVHWRHWWFILAVPWFSYIHVKQKVWFSAYGHDNIYPYATQPVEVGGVQEPEREDRGFREEESEVPLYETFRTQLEEKMAFLRRFGQTYAGDDISRDRAADSKLEWEIKDPAASVNELKKETEAEGSSQHPENTSPQEENVPVHTVIPPPRKAKMAYKEPKQ